MPLPPSIFSLLTSVNLTLTCTNNLWTPGLCGALGGLCVSGKTHRISVNNHTLLYMASGSSVQNIYCFENKRLRSYSWPHDVPPVHFAHFWNLLNCTFVSQSELYPMSEMHLAPNPTFPDLLPIVAWNPWTDIRDFDDVKALNVSFPFGALPPDFQVITLHQKCMNGWKEKRKQ